MTTLEDELPPLPPSWAGCYHVPSPEEAIARGIVCTACLFLFDSSRCVVDVSGQVTLYRCPRCGSASIDWALL